MEFHHLLTAFLVLLCLAETCNGGVLFSSLPQTLVVTASPRTGQVLNAGEDNITVTWGLNQILSLGTDELYKEVKVKLCYAPISQVDRGWRKTTDNLKKDKTCQFTIVDKPYAKNQSFEWRIEKDVPKATYFVRIYACDSAGEELGYGQTTDAKKTCDLFEIHALSGRHVSLDTASICFSAFCLLSLIGFFLVEKRNMGSKKW